MVGFHTVFVFAESEAFWEVVELSLHELLCMVYHRRISFLPKVIDQHISIVIHSSKAAILHAHNAFSTCTCDVCQTQVIALIPASFWHQNTHNQHKLTPSSPASSHTDTHRCKFHTHHQTAPQIHCSDPATLPRRKRLPSHIPQPLEISSRTTTPTISARACTHQPALSVHTRR